MLLEWEVKSAALQSAEFGCNVGQISCARPCRNNLKGSQSFDRWRIASKYCFPGWEHGPACGVWLCIVDTQTTGSG